jgi:large subunit ribosomal protein L25
MLHLALRGVARGALRVRALATAAVASASAASSPASFSAAAAAAPEPAGASAGVGTGAGVGAGAGAGAGLLFEVGRLAAARRDTVGKRNAAWTRMNGLVPGLIYGSGGCGAEPIRVFVKEPDLRAEVNKRRSAFLNTLFDIVVDGVTHRVLPRDFQMHPFKPKFISCNWLRYRPGLFPGVKVDLPLKAINEERCPAYKDGGWLLELIHKLPVYAHGDEIPDVVIMDLRGRRMGEKIMASEIQLNDGLTLVRLARAAPMRGARARRAR